MTEELNVIVINALHYNTDKSKGTRLQIIPIDKTSILDNKNFKGYTVIEQFVSYETFDELNLTDIMQKAVLEFTRVSNFKNPFKTTIKPTALIINNVRINL